MISLTAEKLFDWGGFPITNSLLTTWLGIFFVSALVIFIMRRNYLLPTGATMVLESLYVFFLGLCENVLEDKKAAAKALPFIFTIFVFVAFANLPTVLPGVGSIGIGSTAPGEKTMIPLFRPGASDLNLTLAMALISMLTVQVIGFKTQGLAYLKKFFNLASPLNFFVGVLELISELAKVISFAFRLFGNIFAGEVLLIVLFMLAPYFAPIPFLGLEIFVSLIQAFVFAMLTLVFIKLALVPPEHLETKK